MNFFFVAGFDFGTSYSKVVLQDQLTGIQKVVTFGDQFGALFPSFLRIGEGWISGPEGNYDELILSYPKLIAADAGSKAVRFQSVTSENYIEAKKQVGINDSTLFAKTVLVRFFISVIQGIHHFLENDVDWKIFDPSVDPLVIQIAVPSGLLQHEDREVELLMVRSLMTATWLHDNGTEPLDYSWSENLTHAIREFDSLSANSVDQLSKRCIAYPEVAAGVQPILQSRSVRDAKFVTLDVGAGTIDLNVFHRWTKSGKKTLDYWACQVKPLGFARLALADQRSNRGDHEVSVSRIPEKDLMKRVLSSVVSVMEDAFVYQPYETTGNGASPWDGETLAYIWGGGSEYPAYQRTFKSALKEFHIGIHEINQLPKPNTNLKLPQGLKFGRLAVAFGLSYHHPNLKEVRLPSALQSYADLHGANITKPNQPRGYREKTITSESNCSCNGMNSSCPRCLGSGIIRKEEPKANLTALISDNKKPKTDPPSTNEVPSSPSKSSTPRSDQSNKEPYREQCKLIQLLVDFTKLPRPIPLARRVRALNIIRKQSLLIDKNSNHELLKKVNGLLSQQVGKKGKVFIIRGSAKLIHSGCEVSVIITKEARGEIRILHKDPNQLLKTLNFPNKKIEPHFFQLSCMIIKDRETGAFILRSTPPYQKPLPVRVQ